MILLYFIRKSVREIIFLSIILFHQTVFSTENGTFANIDSISIVIFKIGTLLISSIQNCNLNGTRKVNGEIEKIYKLFSFVHRL